MSLYLAVIYKYEIISLHMSYGQEWYSCMISDACDPFSSPHFMLVYCTHNKIITLRACQFNSLNKAICSPVRMPRSVTLNNRRHRSLISGLSQSFAALIARMMGVSPRWFLYVIVEGSDSMRIRSESAVGDLLEHKKCNGRFP